MTLFFTGVTAALLLALIAVWALAGGVVEIAEAVRLRCVGRQVRVEPGRA